MEYYNCLVGINKDHRRFTGDNQGDRPKCWRILEAGEGADHTTVYFRATSKKDGLDEIDNFKKEVD